MDGAVKLAELKGYITAKVDQYTEMANTCVKSISIDRVITDMNNILDLIMDMQGQKAVTEFSLETDSFLEFMESMRRREGNKHGQA